MAVTHPMLLAALLACGGSDPPKADWQAQYAAWRHPDPLPAFELIDQDGDGFSLERYADDWLLLGFIFTRCPMETACPLTMTKMVQIQGGVPEVALLAVTLDPAFDTPDKLRAYGATHGADFSRFTLATGPDELMSKALPSLFNVLSLPDGPANFTHTVKLALLKPGLVLHSDYDDNAVSPEIVRAAVASAP